MRTPFSRYQVLAASIATLVFTSAHPGQAAEVLWDVTPGGIGTGDGAITGGVGTWNDFVGNWTTDGGLNNTFWNSANNDTAVFGGTAGTVTLDAPVFAGGLTFNTTGYTVTGNTLTLAGETNIITANSGITATIASILAGSSGFTKAGAGTVILANNSNTYTGSVSVTGGTLQLANTSGGLTHTFTGTSLSVNTASLLLGGTNGGTAVTHTYNFPNLASPIQITDGSLKFSSGTASTKTFNAPVNFTGTNSIDYASGSFTHNLNLNSPITGSGTLTFNWSGGATGRSVNIASGLTNNFTGTVVLGASTGAPVFNLNSSLGATSYEIRNAWILNSSAANGLDSASSIRVVDAASVLNLRNSWSNSSGVLTVSNGKVDVGTASNPATIAIASIQQAGGSVDLEISGASNDKIILSGSYDSTGGVVNVNVTGRPTLGTYELLTYGGTLNPAAVINLNGLASSRLIGALNRGSGTNDKVTVTISGTVGNLIWSGANSGVWDTNTTQNFTNSGTPDVFKSFDHVVFDESAGSTHSAVALTGLVSAGVVTVNNSAFDYTFSGSAGNSLTGATQLTKQGTGALTIGAPNAHSGTTTLSSGTLRIGNNAALGTGPLVVQGGKLSSDGTTARALSNSLDLDGTFILGDATDSGAITLSGAGTLSGNATINTPAGTVTNVISGALTDGASSFSLTKSGTTGILTLGAANTYDGGTTIGGGRLTAGNAGSFGTGDVSVADGAQAFLSFGSGIIANNFSVSGLGFTESAGQLGALRLNGGSNISGTVTLTGNSRITAYNSNGTISGKITQSGGVRKLELGGTGLGATGGTVTLSGNNDYTGGTEIRNVLVNANASTALGSGSILVEGAASATRLTLADGVNFPNPLTINATTGTAGRGLIEAAVNGTATLSGPITINGNASAGGHFAVNGAGTLAISGGITSSVPVVFRTGTIEISGGGSYDLLAVTGTVRLAANNGIATNATLQLGVSASATFDLAGFNQTLTGLTRVASTTNFTNNGFTPSTLTLQITGTNSYSGGSSGDVSVIKTGSGVLEFSGVNNYYGATQVNAGTLLVNGSLSGTAVTVNNGGTLGGTGVITTAGMPFTIVSGGKLAPGNLAAGNLTIDSSGAEIDLSSSFLGASGSLVFELGDPALFESSDRITLSAFSTLNIGSGQLDFSDLAFSTTSAFTGGTFTLVDTSAAIVGTLGSGVSGSIGGFDATLSFSEDGQDLLLTVVPEPTSITSLLGGFGFLLGLTRRRTRR